MSLFITTVISRTPLWVWVLLAALVALGLMQARDHVLTRTRVLIQPIALGAMSFWSASSAFGWHALVQPTWLVGFALGFVLNQSLRLPRRVQAMPDGRFAVGASWVPLGLILAIFMMRYVGAVSLAVVPQLAALPLFAAAVSLLYGLPSGLLAARARRLLQTGQRPAALQPAGASAG